MVKTIEVATTVFTADSRDVTEGSEIRVDEVCKIISVGRVKLKASELIQAPTESGGKINFVSQRYRFVTQSNSETRDLVRFVHQAREEKATESRKPLTAVSATTSRDNKGAKGKGSKGGARRGVEDNSDENKPQVQGPPVEAETEEALAGAEKTSGTSTASRFSRSSVPLTTKSMAYIPFNNLHNSSRPGGSRTYEVGRKGVASRSTHSRVSQVALVNSAGSRLGLPAAKDILANRSGGERSSSRGAGDRRYANTALTVVRGHQSSGGIRRALEGEVSMDGSRGKVQRVDSPPRTSGIGNKAMGRLSREEDKSSDDFELGSTPTPRRTSVFRSSHSAEPGTRRLLSPVHSYTQGQGQSGLYRTERESLSRREGFRNMGNTCYVNACLQALLSLNGFIGDLQRECWVRAMVLPQQVSTTSLGTDRRVGSAVETPRVDGPDGGGGSTSASPRKHSLYEALLRLSLEARGYHGVMDASPLKRAMDGHSDRFAGNLQQDAHEFLTDLVNVLHEETEGRLEVVAASVPSRKQASTVTLNATPSSRSNGLTLKDKNVTVGSTAADSGSGSVDDTRGDSFAKGKAAVNGANKEPAGRKYTTRSGDTGGTTKRGSYFPSRKSRRLKGGAVEVEAPDPGAGEIESRKDEGDGGNGGERREGKSRGADAGDSSSSDRLEQQVKQRLMPTTRHFHAEVEVTLTCRHCKYSRQRRELYRDFSLDIPERTPEGRDASGLDDLLDGFFRSRELTLRCERCDHDSVRAEYSLVTLPGTLVLHIKRFKPVVALAIPPAAPVPIPLPVEADVPSQVEGDKASIATTTESSGVNGRGIDDGQVSAEQSQQETGRGGGDDSVTAGGISYVKLKAPVSVPRGLDLERFCTEFTANSPHDDLGKPVESLEAVELQSDLSTTASTARLSSPSLPPTPTSRSRSRSREGNGDLHDDPRFSGSKKRCSAGISVDLSAREGWDDGDAGGGKRARGGDGGSPAGSVPVEEGPNSLKSPSAAAIHGSGGVPGALSQKDVNSSTTPSERRLAAKKERSERTHDQESFDRWEAQDKLGVSALGRPAGRRPTPSVVSSNHFLDHNGNIDYLKVMTKQGAGARRLSNCTQGREEAGGWASGGGRSNGGGGGGSCAPSAREGVGGGLVGARLGKSMAEVDAEEARQMRAALEASREDIPSHLRDERTELERALRLSEGEGRGGEMMLGGVKGGGSTPDTLHGGEDDFQKALLLSMGGKSTVYDRPPAVTPPPQVTRIGTDDVWECTLCTFHNSPSALSCEMCEAQRPPPALQPERRLSCELEARNTPSRKREVSLEAGPEREPKPEPKQDVEPELEPEPEPETSSRIRRKEPLRSRYSLRGVLHHLGETAFTGHYVTDIREVLSQAGKHQKAGKGATSAATGQPDVVRWERHNDSVVVPVSQAVALEGAARSSCYMCFYSMDE